MINQLIRLRYKKTYICQFELVAIVAAYLSFPEVLQGRLVHHFVDNMPALQGAIKGSSSAADSARVIHQLHISMTRLQCNTWFSFVYSEDNLSDLPSRSEFLILQQMGAVRRECKPLGSRHGD